MALLLQCMDSQVVVCELSSRSVCLVAPWHMGPQFPDQGLNLHLLHCFLVAQLVKNPFAVQGPSVQFLGREDLLEKG